ncbi:TRAP transporter large permease subunit [Clostridia bacterium OttesenSCG-928-O13]|nr:TRAP transporter large permease subunit [Clostridia bacterium OttesenSCG-928-O13]
MSESTAPATTTETPPEKVTFGSRLDKVWTSCENVVSALFLAFGIGLMFYQVLSRYFFGFSIFWTEEIVRYLVIWSNFIGASMIVKTDDHVSVTFFIDKLNEGRRAVIEQATNILSACYSLFLLVTGISLVREALVNGAISDTRLETPMFIPYIIMPLAGLLITCRYIQKIIKTKLPAGWYKDKFTYVVLALVVALFAFIAISNSPIAIMLVGMFLLMFMGMPIGFAMGLMGSLVLYLFDIVSWSAIASKQFWATNSFTMLAIPFFIFAGSIIAKTPMGQHIVNFVVYLFKKVRGGVGIAVMVASIIFASMSGSSIATAATLGMVCIPMLRKAGYPDSLSAGMLGAGGTLAVIVPPSSILVLYGAISGASIANLFVAGTFPGIALCAILCIYVYIRARRGKFGAADREEPFEFRELWRLFLKAIPALLIPLIIMGTIYSGLTTPTEAAVVASVYAIVVSLVVYRIKLKDVYQVLVKTVQMSAMIYFIIMSSALFGFIISMERIPQMLLGLVTGSNIGPLMFLMLMNLMIPVLGFFLGPAAILVMIVPIILPITTQLGISPIHLGIILALNMEMDFIMPPLGTNLYVLAGAAKVNVGTVIKGVLPFIAIMLVALVLITIFPQISLFAL